VRGNFRVVDMHHHVLQPEEVGVASGQDAYLAPSVDDFASRELIGRIASMDANGVDQAFVLPGHGYLRPNGVADTRRINDHVAAYSSANLHRFPHAVGVVEPLHGPASFSELTRLTTDLSMVGVSFHTRFQGVSVDSRLVYKLVERMEELRLTPFVHAIGESAEESLWKVLDLAAAFPDTQFVVLDAFASFEQSKQALAMGGRGENTLFDTSLLFTFKFMETFVQRYGAHRVCFGSDLYSCESLYADNPILQQIIDSGLSDGDKQAILAGNILGLIGEMGRE
jgi:predicted TIM-barrel fold metal-dependent hydrolase